MPLFAADEDDSAFDIVGGVQYGYNRAVHKIVKRSDMTRHKRVVSKWTSSRELSFLVASLALKAEVSQYHGAGSIDSLGPSLRLL